MTPSSTATLDASVASAPVNTPSNSDRLDLLTALALALGSESQVSPNSASQARRMLRLCSFAARARVELYEPLTPGARARCRIGDSPAWLLFRLASVASQDCVQSLVKPMRRQKRPFSTLRALACAIWKLVEDPIVQSLPAKASMMERLSNVPVAERMFVPRNQTSTSGALLPFSGSRQPALNPL